MPMIVVVGNEKGGAGKTMTAVNLAAQAAVAGQSVLLVDTDGGNQATATRWITARATLHPTAAPVATVQMQGANLRRDLVKVGQAYDLVVVDTAPADTPELRACMAIADVLVVPVKPSNFELWALQKIAQLLYDAQAFNTKLRAVVAVNRIQRHMKPDMAVADVAGFIEEHAQGLTGSPILTIYERIAYDQASGAGLGVAEWQGARDKAAAEFAALFEAVMTPQQQEFEV